MKKFLSLTISLVLTCCFFVSPVSAHESTFNHTLPDIVIDSDVEIPENILEELQNEYPDAVQITIYGYYEVPEPTAPEIAPQYVDKISKANKTTTQYNVMTKNEFIISVAKDKRYNCLRPQRFRSKLIPLLTLVNIESNFTKIKALIPPFANLGRLEWALKRSAEPGASL